ncbi:hypothetical protein CRG98_033111 [Punica granatum]|uniref:Uncharacterized protein n=1 Tax=Punica granatum TaxID=22663 RepID=A0A2I0IR67_PUNGR|nr:hypothetical protein CRG98_033111 [Punica granatum]
MRDKQNSHPGPSNTARTRDPQGKWPGYLLQHDSRSTPQRSSTVLGGFFLKNGAQAGTPSEHFAIAYRTRSRKKRGGITGTTNAGTTADSDFRSLGIRRRSTPELESHITRLGHPQQTGNRPNSGTSLRQINAFTVAYLMLLSNKFLIVRQMAIDANHRVPFIHDRKAGGKHTGTEP